MRNSNSHTKTYRKKLNKCRCIFYAYSELAYRYGDVLNKREDIVSIDVNVKLLGCSLGDNYTTDFYCLKDNGEYLVRECVYKEKLLSPKTLKLLSASRNFWLSKGIKDWGIVINEN